MMKKRILTTLAMAALALLAVFLLTAPVEAAETIGSGACGANLTWVLTDDYILTISGTGAMADYSWEDFPWLSSCYSIRSVIIEDGVTSIGAHAFYNCSAMTSVEIAETVTSIGDYAFQYCSSLTSLEGGNSLTSIGTDAFAYCDCLTSIKLGAGVTSIGERAFRGCKSLTEVTVPDSVTSIESDTFQSCTALKSIVLPDSVTRIGSGAFYDCSSLTSITLPDGVPDVAERAFRGCTSLTSITLPDSVTSIGNYAFSGCSALTNIAIPDGVTSIGERAFRGCTSLTSITVPDGVTNIAPYTFAYCTSLTSAKLPDGVTSIGNYAFVSCSSLASFTIPDSVTSIGSGAFYRCASLVGISVPGSVKGIGDFAFADCSCLTVITFEGTTNPHFYQDPILEKECCFENVTATVYYPDTQAWTEDVRQNYGGTLTWVAIALPEMDASSLTLGNILKLNISVLQGRLPADATSLRVTVGDDEDYTVISDYVSDGEYLVYTVLLPAYRLYERVTLELVYDDIVVDSETWTAEAYFEALKESNSEDEALLELLGRLSDYGKYAAYLASPDITAPAAEAVETVTQDALVGYEPVLRTSASELKAVVSLYIDDACGLRFKFDAAAWEGCTLYVDGVAAEVTVIGSQVVYEIADLIPQDWGTAYNVQVTDSEDTILLDMDYSVMSYAYARLTQAAEAQPGLNGLLKAMYLYHKAAETYAA